MYQTIWPLSSWKFSPFPFTSLHRNTSITHKHDCIRLWISSNSSLHACGRGTFPAGPSPQTICLIYGIWLHLGEYFQVSSIYSGDMLTHLLLIFWPANQKCAFLTVQRLTIEQIVKGRPGVAVLLQGYWSRSLCLAVFFTIPARHLRAKRRSCDCVSSFHTSLYTVGTDLRHGTNAKILRCLHSTHRR